MRNLKATILIVFIFAGLSSCGSSLKKKVEGKWRWESIKSVSGDNMSMMDDELYFSFKKGLYLYTDVSSGSVENWADAVPYTIDEENKVMTVKTKTGNIENYEIKFPDGDHLHLTINDPSSSLFRDTWILKKAK